jgi:hypothetical protein
MVKRPAISLALFVVTVLLTVVIASYAQAQTSTCDPAVETCANDSLALSQSFLADAIPTLAVLASGGVGLALGRIV